MPVLADGRQQNHPGLRTRTLGRTTMTVTELSLGGVGFGGLYGPVPEPDGIGAVHRALDLGINYIDTSPLYKDSERRIGIALDGGKRDGIFLSTKTGTHPAHRQDYSAEGTRWTVENSLRLLNTNYIDLLMVHDPQDINAPLAPGAAFDVLHDYKERGVCGAVGMGQRNHDFHRRAIEAGTVDAILTFADYSLIRQTASSLIDDAYSAGVGVIVAQAVMAGLLAGPDPSTDARLRSHPDRAAAMRWHAWARDREVSLLAVALQFVLRNPKVACVVVGAKTAGEIQQNVEVVTMPIPEAIWTELDALIAQQRTMR